MSASICKVMVLLPWILFSLAVAGCATTEETVSWQYTPIVLAGGGGGEGGEILLSMQTRKNPRALEKAGMDNDLAARWVVGKVTNAYGQELGPIFSPVATDELLLDAFGKELRAAGYKVKVVDAMPKGVSKGVVLTHVSVDMVEVLGRITIDGACTVKISINLWRNGALVFKMLTYEASYSDFALTDRNQLPQTVLYGALHKLMKKAVPNVIGM